MGWGLADEYLNWKSLGLDSGIREAGQAEGKASAAACDGGTKEETHLCRRRSVSHGGSDDADLVKDFGLNPLINKKPWRDLKLCLIG